MCDEVQFYKVNPISYSDLVPAPPSPRRPPKVPIERSETPTPWESYEPVLYPHVPQKLVLGFSSTPTEVEQPKAVPAKNTVAAKGRSFGRTSMQSGDLSSQSVPSSPRMPKPLRPSLPCPRQIGEDAGSRVSVCKRNDMLDQAKLPCDMQRDRQCKEALSLVTHERHLTAIRNMRGALRQQVISGKEMCETPTELRSPYSNAHLPLLLVAKPMTLEQNTVQSPRVRDWF